MTEVQYLSRVQKGRAESYPSIQRSGKPVPRVVASPFQPAIIRQRPKQKILPGQVSPPTKHG